MAIERQIKRKVTEDWQNAFPQLTIYTQNKFYKRVGPFVMGIELVSRFQDDYQPHFVIYSLSGENVKTSLDFPVILMGYRSNKNLQFSMQYKGHPANWNELMTSIAEQTPLKFDGDISLGQLEYAIDEYAHSSRMKFIPDSYFQAVLQERKLEFALCIDTTKAEKVLAEIKKRNWNNEHFARLGKDVQTWLKDINEKLERRDQLLQQIEINKADPKIMKLQHSDFV